MAVFHWLDVMPVAGDDGRLAGPIAVLGDGFPDHDQELGISCCGRAPTGRCAVRRGLRAGRSRSLPRLFGPRRLLPARPHRRGRGSLKQALQRFLDRSRCALLDELVDSKLVDLARLPLADRTFVPEDILKSVRDGEALVFRTLGHDPLRPQMHRKMSPVGSLPCRAYPRLPCSPFCHAR